MPSPMCSKLAAGFHAGGSRCRGTFVGLNRSRVSESPMCRRRSDHEGGARRVADDQSHRDAGRVLGMTNAGG